MLPGIFCLGTVTRDFWLDSGDINARFYNCFHVIYEIGRGTCGALMSKVRKAEKEHENAIKQTLSIEGKKEKFDEKRPRGRRPHFEEKIEQAKQEEEQVKEDLEQARLNYETVRNAKAEIGKVYHPYNLKNRPKTGFGNRFRTFVRLL